MKKILMEEMNWVDIKNAIEEGYRTVVVGVGSTEQHGPHLPTQTDALIADVLSIEIAKKIGNALVARTICVGCSEHHITFPGTISLKKETLKLIIRDYVDSLSRTGFKNVILIPSHGGNFDPVQQAIEELEKLYPNVRIIGYTDLVEFLNAIYETASNLGITNEDAGAHAGEMETSVILALKKHLVAKERFQRGFLGILGENEIKLILEKGMSAISAIGVIGDPTKADIPKGKIYIEKLVDFLVSEIQKKMKAI
jgi:creatinine amidohydrolase